MTLTASEIASLQASLDWWESAEYWCIGLVALGAIGESLAEFTDWLTKGQDNRKKRLEKCSAVLLIVALILEGVCTERSNKFSGILIGSLNDTAREFESQISQAKLEAETEHLDRVKLEKSLDWRRVSQKQAQEIRKSLSSLNPNIRVEVHADMRDPETAQYALDLLEVFRKPGDSGGVGNTMSPPSRFGLWVDTVDPSEAVARSLTSILKANGIEVTGIHVHDVDSVRTEDDRKEMPLQIILYVGFRPIVKVEAAGTN